MSNGEDNNSLSESSSDSQKNQPVMFRDGNNSDFGELAMYGTPTSMFSRTGTVRRVSSSSTIKKEKDTNEIKDTDLDQTSNVQVSQTSPDSRYRRSLDSTYRFSLESISEYKPKLSFSSSLYPNRGYSSLESSSSECTLSDNVVKSCIELTNEQADNNSDNGSGGGGVDNEKTIKSSASSYLSWIESVHSEYFGTTSQQTPTTISDTVSVDVDGKVGEWNNFWLNYSSARNRYLSSTTSQYLNNYNKNSSNDNNNTDDLSDIRSTTSTQKEFIERNSLEQICMTMDEINEMLNCSKRIIEILEKAINRNEHESNDSKNDSFYSQPYSRHTSIKEEPIIAPRERSFSYAIGVQDFQKTKLLSKTAPQSTSSSCINAILSTGVGDILKKVIAKRRNFTNTTSVSSIPGATAEEVPRLSRASFSEWTFGR